MMTFFKNNFQKDRMILFIFFLFILFFFSRLNAQENIEFQIDNLSAGKKWLLWKQSSKIVKITQTDQLVADSFFFDVDLTFKNEEKRDLVKKKEQYSKNSLIAILFYPPVNPTTAQKYCQQLIQCRPKNDLIFMINGDEISGHFIRIQERCLEIEIAGEPIFLPLSKIRAIRFALPKNQNAEIDKEQ